jgi:hypothetical protein
MSSQSSQTELNNSLMIASSPLKTIYPDETIMSIYKTLINRDEYSAHDSFIAA